ncbi:hypothetical protein [Roseicella aerolata]|jgi:hypothetical protein|uniref:Uncharacterized protein n=1 Tax=Roseicella aerolata TaxID=2883479 RepID=A0A9X1IJ17_9PROT|nr:hypothetical protein [Roseicella aerolata]MCB4824999.1 hypothetical protein [Roseicella aerolata]
MTEERASLDQHSLALLRRIDAKLDDVIARLSILERRGALRDEEQVMDRLTQLELRQRLERLERRIDLVDPALPPDP